MKYRSIIHEEYNSYTHSEYQIVPVLTLLKQFLGGNFMSVTCFLFFLETLLCIVLYIQNKNILMLLAAVVSLINLVVQIKKQKKFKR